MVLKKIIHASYNPADLIRDLQYFTEQGNQIAKPISDGSSFNKQVERALQF
ncbi:hypothetical protein [Limosilactobacillus gorillae]|uniref:hypothetical protein n=1 Tax=Limosilactobacillus gorillae TaxID=1450649 RepID=UPI000A99B5DB|nr:hypothetical protein [Limosilactobacillus gorillae]